MSPMPLGFGVEIEAAVQPLYPYDWDDAAYYKRLAYYLNKCGLPTEADDCLRYNKNHDYRKWWITRDGSVKPQDGCIAMEIVSPILKSHENWEAEIAALWMIVRDRFWVHRNETAGSHVHVAPINRAFTLREVKAIAFACCYYEPYVVSLLPSERRNHKYCNRNSNIAEGMGYLIRCESVYGIREIREEINRLDSVERICEYMQGGMKKQHRYVLWNFQNLAKRTGTVEFRGGRHLRGPKKTTWWITFAVVFVSMAIDQNFVKEGPPYRVPKYEEADEVQRFWTNLLKYASRMAMRSNLPADFRMMSEEESDYSSGDSESEP